MLWFAKPETADRVRARAEAVIAASKIRGWRDGPNPFAWRGHLALLLPAKAKVRAVRHHAAIDWQAMPRFMAYAAAQPGVAWCAIRFTVLTAARSGEVRHARWREIDLRTKTWTVPAERMKARREHRVPLSDAAIELLGEPREPGDLLFAAGVGGVQGDLRLSSPLRTSGFTDGQGRSITVHGMRSAFRDWVAEATDYPGEAAELALAHSVSSATEAAYRRGDQLERRKMMMTDWARHCAGPIDAGAQIIPPPRGGRCRENGRPSLKGFERVADQLDRIKLRFGTPADRGAHT